MFLWISSNFCPQSLLHVRSHEAETIIQQRNHVEFRLSNRSRRKNEAFTLSATLPTTFDYAELRFCLLAKYGCVWNTSDFLHFMISNYCLP